MTPKHITIVYPITSPDHEEQLLAAGRWIASCHGDAMAERDALQGELENATAIAGMNATDRDVKARACLKLEAALAEMTRGYEAARLEIASLKNELAKQPKTNHPRGSYAGVVMWIGDHHVTRRLSEVDVQSCRTPGFALRGVAQICADALVLRFNHQTQYPK